MTTTLALPLRPPSDRWQQHALCRNEDPEVFFAGPGVSTAPAKRVCRMCPVRLDCLAASYRWSAVDGVWGGYTPAERRQLRRCLAGVCDHPSPDACMEELSHAEREGRP